MFLVRFVVNIVVTTEIIICLLIPFKTHRRTVFEVQFEGGNRQYILTY